MWIKLSLIHHYNIPIIQNDLHLGTHFHPGISGKYKVHRKKNQNPKSPLIQEPIYLCIYYATSNYCGNTQAILNILNCLTRSHHSDKWGNFGTVVLVFKNWWECSDIFCSLARVFIVIDLCVSCFNNSQLANSYCSQIFFVKCLLRALRIPFTEIPVVRVNFTIYSNQLNSVYWTCSF